MRDEHEVTHAVMLYANTVRRICFLHLNNREDTEDVFQTVFLKYLLYTGSFENEEHEKAWIIRVAINACKDFRRGLFRHAALPLDLVSEEAFATSPKHRDVLEAVLSLPAKYKDAIYLHYFEGYSAAETGQLLEKKENTIYSLLSRGRSLLEEKLGGDFSA